MTVRVLFPYFLFALSVGVSTEAVYDDGDVDQHCQKAPSPIPVHWV